MSKKVLVLHTPEVGSDSKNRNSCQSKKHSSSPTLLPPKLGLTSQTRSSKASLGLSCAVNPAPNAPVLKMFLWIVRSVVSAALVRVGD